jgi:ceramide glucosyltransferase
MLLYLWWAAALVFYFLGTVLVLPARRVKAVPEQELPGVSILKPLKGADEGLEGNLESFFLLNYPRYELIFSVAEASDPACHVVERLRKRHPGMNARLVIGLEGDVPNPKVNNLIRSYGMAAYDLLMISDSNVRVDPGYLRRAVAQFTPETGVLTAVVAGVEPHDKGGVLEATYLNTFYARGMRLAFFFGRPCVIGKSMLFRKSDANRFGGISSLGEYLAEDYMMGVRMLELGLKVGLMADPIRQYVGVHSFASFWKRHLRWGRIRKAHAPIAFLTEPLSSPLLAALGSGLALHRLTGFAIAPGIAIHFFAFFLLDLLVALRVGGRQRHLISGWLLRELLALPMWVVVASGNEVEWRGRLLKIQPGGKIREEEVACTKNLETTNHSFGELQPPRTRLRDTTNTAIGGNGRPKAILPEG